MKVLTNWDLNKNELQNASMHKLASPPASPVEGQTYYNTALHREFYYNGTEWIGKDAQGATMTGTDIVNAINGSPAIIDDDNLSANVNDAISKAHDTHAISDVSGLQSALDGKVNNSRVLTDVPAGAKFTDTIYTLPVAGTAIGGVKSGGDITVDTSGSVQVNDNSHNHTIANVTDLQSALDGKATSSHDHEIASVTGLQAALDAKSSKTEAQGYASTAENNAKAYADTAVADLVGSAPGTLDTLHELATALGNDPNFATTITNQLALRAKKYTTAIGNGTATSITVTHNLGTRDVVVTIRETGSPYAMVMADVEMTTTNSITVKFATAPTSSQYTVTVVG